MLLNGGASIDTHDFYTAACHLDLIAVEMLLNSPKIDVSDRNAALILGIMASRGDKRLAALFLTKGADINYTDINNGGHTHLTWACKLNNARLIQYLIQLGADVTKPAKNGKTPLMYACQYENIEAVKLILDKMTDPAKLQQKSSRFFGKTAACMTKNPGIQKMIEARIIELSKRETLSPSKGLS